MCYFMINCFVNKNNNKPKRYIVKKKYHKDLTNTGKSICFKLVVAEKCSVYELSIITVFRKRKKDTIA